MFTRLFKQKSAICCLVVSIIIIFGGSIANTNGFLRTKNQFLQFDDFSALTQYHNGSFIKSINHNSSLVFEPSYNGGSASVESYILIFDEHGSCVDFSISLIVEYEYTSAFLGEFEFLAGAYLGTQTSRIFGCSMDDDSSGEGLFMINIGNTGFGHVSFTQSGKVQFNIERTSNQYTIEIFKDDVLVDNAGGSSNTKINFFQIKFEPHSELYYFDFQCTTFEGEISTDGIAVNYNPLFDDSGNGSSGLQIFFIILGSFLGIFVLSGFGSFVMDRVRRRQRVNRILEQRETTDEEEMDETEIEVFGQEFSEPLVIGPTTEPHHLADKKQAAQSLLYRTVAKEMLFDEETMGTARCMICKKELKQEQEVYQCPYCEAFFHKEHFVVWVNVKGTCPVCHQKVIEK
jgi:hypothetical protein